MTTPDDHLRVATAAHRDNVIGLTAVAVLLLVVVLALGLAPILL
ncbi:MAG: hypothetical protein ABIU87_08010 [Ornithinibacter sp.]